MGADSFVLDRLSTAAVTSRDGDGSLNELETFVKTLYYWVRAAHRRLISKLIKPSNPNPINTMELGSGTAVKEVSLPAAWTASAPEKKVMVKIGEGPREGGTRGRESLLNRPFSVIERLKALGAQPFIEGPMIAWG